jgi:hypothetical protein
MYASESFYSVSTLLNMFDIMCVNGGGMPLVRFLSVPEMRSVRDNPVEAAP